LTAASHTVREVSQARGNFPHLSGLSAQRKVEFLTLRLAPAIAGGMIAYLHLHSEWQGLLVFASMMAAVTVLRRPSYPLHLIPLASAILYLLAPPIGAGTAVLISISDGSPSSVTVGHMVAPVLGAWLVTALGAWVAHRFRNEREVRVAVIGSHEFARGLQAELKAVGVPGYKVVGCIDPRQSCSNSVVAGTRCLGSLALLRQTVLDSGIELLVLGPLGPAEGETSFEGAPSRLEVFEQVADSCLDLPVSMIESGQLYESLFGHVPLGTTTSAWFQYMLHPSYEQELTVRKRILDVVLSSVVAVLAAPFVLLAAIAIKAWDRGPILHHQIRIGEGGREIDVPKLRTMRPNADDGKAKWTAGSDDDRITPVGHLLRRLHIDELPQLWLVLTGEMSLVGPRPEQPSIVGDLEARFPYYDRRHLIKPGITGWAQVRCGYGGSHLGSAWKLCHDLYYLKKRSMLFDLLIILETASAVFVPEPSNRPDERFIVAYRPDSTAAPVEAA
jgi:lipopolysaccharide/colanic/teichoic acid biosynthesis glycosyltransferase